MKRWWRWGLLLSVLTVAPHFFFPQREWVYDDRAVVGENSFVQRTDFASIWTTPYWSGVPSVYQKDNLFRPLFLSTVALWHEFPEVLRALVVISHLLAGLLVAIAAWRFTRRESLAVAAAGFFLVAPGSVEVTAQAVGLMETMPFVLGFGALLIADRHPRWAVALVALAPGWKETGFVWMLLVIGKLLYDKRRALAAVGGFLFLAWLAARAAAYGAVFSSHITPFSLLNPLVDMTTFDGWLTRVALLGHYLRLILLPLELSCDWSRGALPVPAYPLQVWFLLGAGALVWAWRERARIFTWERLPLWGSFLTLLPVLHLTFPVGVIFAERFNYAFTAGVILALALFPNWRSHRALALIALAIFIVDYARMTERHRDWQDAETLFVTDSARFPFSAKLRYNVAIVLGRQQRWQATRDELLRAVELEPNFPDAHFRLYLAYRELGDEKQANVHKQAAIQLGNTPAQQVP